MRIAFFSDVHGNLSALEVILADIEAQDPDMTVFLGDAVSFGPFSTECLGKICSVPGIVLIRGNHESVMLEPEFPFEALSRRIPEALHEQIENQKRTYDTLTDHDRALMDRFEHQVVIDVEGRSVSMVHGSPESNIKCVSLSASDEEYGRVLGEHDLSAFGHIHTQILRRVGERVYLNPGGAGAPIDRQPGAAYAIAEVQRTGVTVQLNRLPYDPTPELTKLFDEEWPLRNTIKSMVEKGINPYIEARRRARQEGAARDRAG